MPLKPLPLSGGEQKRGSLFSGLAEPAIIKLLGLAELKKHLLSPCKTCRGRQTEPASLSATTGGTYITLVKK